MQSNNKPQTTDSSKKPHCCSKKNACNITKDLTDQVIIITGASTGIGKETARLLASMGATLILACRDEKKTLPVVQELQQDTKNDRIEFMRLDLSDLASIRQFVVEFKTRYQNLHILINNAGLTMLERTLSKDGFELVFATNHLGHFYLTSLLLDTLKNSAPSRIINVSSDLGESGKMNWNDLMFEKGYGVFPVYKQSKLANVLFTKELQKRLEGTNVKAVALHPGVIQTELNREAKKKWQYRILVAGLRLIQKTPVEGAQTSLYCAIEDFDKLQGGAYYANCRIKAENPEARKEENYRRLWEVSEKLISEKISD